MAFLSEDVNCGAVLKLMSLPCVGTDSDVGVVDGPEDEEAAALAMVGDVRNTIQLSEATQ